MRENSENRLLMAALECLSVKAQQQLDDPRVAGLVKMCHQWPLQARLFARSYALELVDILHGAGLADLEKEARAVAADAETDECPLEGQPLAELWHIQKGDIQRESLSEKEQKVLDAVLATPLDAVSDSTQPVDRDDEVYDMKNALSTLEALKEEIKRVDADTARAVASKALRAQVDSERRKLAALQARRRQVVDSDLGNIVDELTAEPCDTAKTAKAAGRLADWCQGSHSRRDAAREAGALSALVKMLSLHVRPFELAEFARALVNACFEHSTNAEFVIELGVMVPVLQRIADDASDHWRLVQLWMHLAESASPAYESAVRRAAEIDAVLTSLVTLISSSYVADEQVLAADTVRMLATDLKLRDRLSRKGARGALAKALSRKFVKRGGPSEVAAAKDAALKALLVLTVEDHAISDAAFTSLNGAARALESFAVEESSSDKDDRPVAVAALTRVLLDRAITTARGAVVFSDIQRLVGLLGIGRSDACWHVEEHASKALQRLAEKFPDVVPAMVLDADAVPALARLMKLASISKPALEAKVAAAMLVRELSSHLDACRAAFVDAGLVASLRALVDATKYPNPKEAGVMALWVLVAADADARKLLLDDDGVRSVTDLVVASCTNRSDEAAILLLTALANDDPDLLLALRDHKALIRQLDLNATFSDTEAVRQAAADALEVVGPRRLSLLARPTKKGPRRRFRPWLCGGSSS